MSVAKEKRSAGTDWIGVISFGFFLVLFGTLWIITPSPLEEARNFFTDFQLQQVTGNILFPAPKDSHPIVYTTVMQFCLIFGTFQIVILALRFIFHEPLSRKSKTLSGIVFWLGVGFFLSMLAKNYISWFSFLSGIVISIGLSIIASNFVKLFEG